MIEVTPGSFTEGLTLMEDTNAATKAKTPKSKPGKSLKEMTLNEKLVYLFQVLICMVTFGMVFPNAFG